MATKRKATQIASTTVDPIYSSLDSAIEEDPILEPKLEPPLFVSIYNM